MAILAIIGLFTGITISKRIGETEVIGMITSIHYDGFPWPHTTITFSEYAGGQVLVESTFKRVYSNKIQLMPGRLYLIQGYKPWNWAHPRLVNYTTLG